MKTPRTAQLYTDQNKYWDEHAQDPGPLPAWSFDFISIHDHTPAGFTLVSPMILVDETTGHRPAFETVLFSTYKEAAKGARDICRSRAPQHLLFVVNTARAGKETRQQ